MRIAFLNLCHCEPEIVARTAKRLTCSPEFDMYVHVDQKQDIEPFYQVLQGMPQVYFTKNRQKVYWGGYHAILATLELMNTAINSGKHYDRYVLLQNLDYPIKSNAYITQFFTEYKDKEFIRACKIAQSKDWHFKEKYKLYHSFDDDFYTKKHPKVMKYLHDGMKLLKSVKTIGFNGIIKEKDNEYPLYYGTAQWALTDSCVRYILNFVKTHPKFNEKMKHIKFPDEEYFHTIVHNSKYKTKCIKQNEPEQRWLVNWRNIHYFEYPKEITVFQEKDFEKLINREEIFIRKVRTGISDSLMDAIDERCKKDEL